MSRWLLGIVVALGICVGTFGADNAPATPFEAAQDALRHAKRDALQAARDSDWYRELADKVTQLEQRLAQARLGGTPEERVAASGEWNKARLELEEREATAVRSNKDVEAAQERLDQAKAPPDEESGRNMQARWTDGPTPEPTARDDDRPVTRSPNRSVRHSDPPTSDGGDKSVHVRGYTRKDGTHVKSYDRAAPGHGRGRK
jgi:hypothetical protein